MLIQNFESQKPGHCAGDRSQFVVANMALSENVCKNNCFTNRRQMQLYCLREIKVRFALHILKLPLMKAVLKGLELLGGVVGKILNNQRL